MRAVPDIAYDMSTAQAFHVDGRHFLAFVRAAVDFKNSEVVGNVSAFVKTDASSACMCDNCRDRHPHRGLGGQFARS